MNIYVATSWRNRRGPEVVENLRSDGHEVYDFRNPVPGEHGFHWSQIDPAWQAWTPEAFRDALSHPLAQRGFLCDLRSLARADAVLLLMPCGRSAHLELGYAVGARKLTLILLADGQPELMYAMADHVCISLDEVRETLARIEASLVTGDPR